MLLVCLSGCAILSNTRLTTPGPGRNSQRCPLPRTRAVCDLSVCPFVCLPHSKRFFGDYFNQFPKLHTIANIHSRKLYIFLGKYDADPSSSPPLPQIDSCIIVACRSPSQLSFRPRQSDFQRRMSGSTDGARVTLSRLRVAQVYEIDHFKEMFG